MKCKICKKQIGLPKVSICPACLRDALEEYSSEDFLTLHKYMWAETLFTPDKDPVCAIYYAPDMGKDYGVSLIALPKQGSEEEQIIRKMVWLTQGGRLDTAYVLLYEYLALSAKRAVEEELVRASLKG